MKRFFSKNYQLLFLLLVVIIGAFLRTKGIWDLSFAYTYDVGRDMLELSNIVNNHKVPLIGPTTGLPGLFYGPWWYYILVPAFILGQGDPRAILGFIAFTGIATVVLGYLLAKKLKDNSLALIFASVLSLSFIMIRLTAQIWNPNLAPFFLILLLFLLALLFMSEGKKMQKYPQISLTSLRKSPIVLLLSIGVITGLNIEAEVVYGILLTGSVSLYLLWYLFKQKKLLLFIPYIVGILFIFSPRIFFELRHNFVMTTHIFSLLQSSSGNSFFATIPQEFILALKALKTLWDDTVALQNLYLGWVFIGVTVGVLLTYRQKFSLNMKRMLQFCLFTIVIYILGLSLFHGDIWSHYIVGLPVIYIFLFSVAIAQIVQLVSYKLFVWELFLILLLFYIHPLELYASFRNKPWIGDASLYKNQLEAVNYVYNQSKGDTFNYQVYTPPIHDYTYQYLFQWYGKKTYGYVPVNEKQKRYFFILEPDTLYEYRLSSWLKDREKDGKILSERALPSGIRIQERTH